MSEPKLRKSVGDPGRFTHVAYTRHGIPVRTRSGKLLDKTAPLLLAGVLKAADIAVLDAASDRFALTDDADMALAFALALAAPRQGHIGVELTRVPERLRLPPTADGETSDPRASLPEDLGRWQTQAQNHPAVAAATRHPASPFVFQPTGSHDGILMTCRMWRQQRRLADALRAIAEQDVDWLPNEDTVTQRLDQIYGPAQSGAANFEARRAAQRVASGRLAVITGGPGTGKTWGIKRVLALLIESAQAEGRTLTIALAAPTGKAAVRMAEAMTSDGAIDGVKDETLHTLQSLEPQTLHRLMGRLPHKPHEFRRGKSNQLRADIVVVDEASMIDLVMMRHLVEAIAPGKRLVLLGDRDQLASVDAGTVLADVVGGAIDGRGHRNPALNASVAQLTHSYRFKLAAAIANVAEGLQARDPAMISAAIELMCGNLPEIAVWKSRIESDPGDDPQALARMRWLRPDDLVAAAPAPHGQALPDAVMGALLTPFISGHVDNLRHDATGLLPPQPGYAALIRQRLLATADGDRSRGLTDPKWHRQLLDALGRYRVLAAHRSGPRGVSGLNTWLTTAIQRALTVPARASGSTQGGTGAGRPPEKAGAFWLGQPVMVTRNSYDVNLRNGDIGLVVPRTAPDGRRALWCAFPDPRVTSEAHPGIRYVSLARLPQWETALAMTVHKSQGSQFDRIALVLPAEAGSPILTRELVYTGLTRAMWRVDWVGDRSVLADALGRGVIRASGLAELLWA
ncbi:MAG: AAA family ATPase [Myxococcales bacterium]|nr:AAA family ATPase [Myxococcales bacterium]